jgi:hypothetical protein
MAPARWAKSAASDSTLATPASRLIFFTLPPALASRAARSPGADSANEIR